MTAERWSQVREILYAATEKDRVARLPFLQQSCGEDAELREEVVRLLAALDESDAFLEPPNPAGRDLRGASLGPYLILEQAGQGGMGTVYRAVRRDDYCQEVAVKVVKRDVESAFLLERFRHERQALALLNHPNIARLLDGGTTSDGRPYLVMEWVEGEAITAYCRAHRMSLRRRLELFLHVCDAVAHAHRNLVVHRDLKPSNILITPQGTAKLLDFGIARIISPESVAEPAALTLAGLRALTPDYASPEQVRGEPVTTATDIYSLGVVLYELLTGTLAHRFQTRTPMEIERVVCAQEVPYPSAATTEAGISGRELRGDPDNIVLKAMEKDPARRYSHVDELSGDVRRYLEGRPVLARADSPWYRVSKFARRNKTLVGMAAAGALAMSLGLTLALWQARVAHRERAVAERRFELARRVAGSLLFEVNDQIADLAGSSKAREFLLRRSLEYLDTLSKDAGSNLALARDLANAYARAAELQGSGGVSNLGDPDAGRRSLQKALALLENALAADPLSVPLRRDMAKAHREFVALGGIRPDDPAHARAALSIVEDLLRERPGDAGLLDDLQKSEFTVARSLTALSRFPEAIDYHRKALSHSAGSLPANVALNHKSLGALLIKTGLLDEALREYRAAASLDEQRVAANPADGRAKLDLSYDYADWGMIAARMKHLQDAIELYRKAERIRAAMVAADPRDARAATALVSAEWRMGLVLAGAGERQAAGEAFRKAVRAGESMVATLPDRRVGTQALADACWNIGYSYKEQPSSCAQARPWLIRARDLFHQLGQPTVNVDKAVAECAVAR